MYIRGSYVIYTRMLRFGRSCLIYSSSSVSFVCMVYGSFAYYCCCICCCHHELYRDCSNSLWYDSALQQYLLRVSSSCPPLCNMLQYHTVYSSTRILLLLLCCYNSSDQTHSTDSSWVVSEEQHSVYLASGSTTWFALLHPPLFQRSTSSAYIHMYI